MANTIGTQAAVGNTYTDPGIYYDKRFLDRVAPQLYFKQMGDARPLPLKSGTMIKWTRLNKLTAATTPLTENVNPAEVTVGTTQVSAEPLTYGSWVKVSAELNLKSINPIVEEIQDEQGDQAALTYDTIVFNAVHGNVTNQFGGGAANEAAVADTAVLSSAEIRKAVFTLRNGNIPGFEGNLYKAIIHPAQQFDLLSETAVGTFMEASKYTTMEPLMKGEIGQLYGVRVVVSTNLATGTGATDETYRAFVFGRQCYGVSELSGHGIKTFRFNNGSTENPLEMYSTIGWKFMMAAKVLNSARGVEIYTGSAAS